MPPYNVWNTAAIGPYLDTFAEGDAALAGHLKLALQRPLAKEPGCLRDCQTLPAAAPDWLSTKWAGGGPWHEFAPDAALNEKIRHITDWIRGAMVSGDGWLQDTDDRGRPRKLLKLGTLAQATAEADKAMRRLSQKFNTACEGEDGTETVMTFPDGFRIVRLLTPQALDRETGMMGHCVGNGAYDGGVADGTMHIYSLRDRKNRAHATLKIDTARNALRQCKGKENKPPVARYFPYLRDFIEPRQFALKEDVSHTGLIRQDDRYYSIFALPENLKIEDSLFLFNSGVTALPDNLKINGSLILRGTAITALPDNLEVMKNLDLGDLPISVLPKGLKVGGCLFLPSAITALPEDLQAGGVFFVLGKDFKIFTLDKARQELQRRYPGRAPLPAVSPV